MISESLIIWKREIIRFLRSKSRVIGSLGTPLFLFLVLGLGLGGVVNFGGASYAQYLGPGILGMVLMTNSIVFGIMIIWDRRFGFLKEMLVAPISRLSIMAGKTLGGMSISMIQAIMMYLVVLLMGTPFPGIGGFLLILLAMALISLGFTALGIAIAAKMTDFHGFQIIMNFLIMPLFFLSGAVFPISSMPQWLKIVAYANPLTYGVDLLRFLMIDISVFSITVDLAVLSGFAIATTLLGTYLFSKSEA